MPDFRLKTPTRTCTNVFTNYRRYKRFLITDFSNRCGYCDGSDTWYGGYKTFHIDHFAPKDKFPLLKAIYSNLIYSCPSCNNAKLNKWPSDDPAINILNDKGFLNPVSDDLNKHFTRDDLGNIIGLTTIAKDMIKNLNLHLERHSVLWMLSRLDEIISKYDIALSSDKISDETRIAFEEVHYIFHKLFKKYFDKLKALNS